MSEKHNTCIVIISVGGEGVITPERVKITGAKQICSYIKCVCSSKPPSFGHWGLYFFWLEQDVACLFFLQGTKCLYKFSEKGKDFHICMGKVVVFL